MLTDAKLEANQANAKLSTGPRTEAGKAISSRNALSHGLTATAALLPDEDPAEHQALVDRMLHDLEPINAVETALAWDLIDFEWRLRRASRFEAKILSAAEPDYKALSNMSIHAARLKRQYSATLKELGRLHEYNLQLQIARLARADAITRADAILNRPSTFADHGFDFTLEFLDHWRTLQDAVAYAKQVVEAHGGTLYQPDFSDIPKAA